LCVRSCGCVRIMTDREAHNAHRVLAGQGLKEEAERVAGRMSVDEFRAWATNEFETLAALVGVRIGELCPACQGGLGRGAQPVPLTAHEPRRAPPRGAGGFLLLRS
jgi:hypothetical protein